MRKKWLPVAALVLCTALFLGCRIYDRLRTDSQPPQITVEDTLLRVSLAQGQEALLQGVTARDDTDGDVTGSLLVESITGVGEDGSVTVVYAAFDSSGNVAKQTRSVILTDYESPRFTLESPLVFLYGSGFDPLNWIGAQDLLDGDISHRIRATLLDESTISAEGIHNVRFQVTNSLGDTAVLTLPVEVYHSGRYDGQLSLTDYLIYLPQGAAFDAGIYLESYLISGRELDLTQGLPDTMTLETQGTVDTQAAGVYTVSYLLSYTQGNQIYEGYSKLIVVVEG